MTDAMPPTRRRRIVRRAVMAVAVVVLLVASYVASDGLVWWLKGRGVISENYAASTHLTIHRPLFWYKDSGIPGAKALREFEYSCSDEGYIARERAKE